MFSALAAFLNGGCIAPQHPASIKAFASRMPYVRSQINGTFQGFQYQRVYELQNGQLWQQIEPYIEIGIQAMPQVLIWDDGGVFRMQVSGMQHQIIVKKIPDPEAESEIVDEFHGLRQGNVYALQNGQLWEQTEFYSEIDIEIRPEARIWNNGGTFVMKVAGIEHPVEVRRIKNIIGVPIVGDFHGFSQGSTFVLENGEEWEQKDILIKVGIQIAPKAFIWQDGDSFKMKVSGIPETIAVSRTK
jgi:hypothetical protein